MMNLKTAALALCLLTGCEGDLEVSLEKALKDCDADPFTGHCLNDFFETNGSGQKSPKGLKLSESLEDGYLSAAEHQQNEPIFQYSHGNLHIFFHYSAFLPENADISCKDATYRSNTSPSLNEVPTLGRYFLCVRFTDQLGNHQYHQSPMILVDATPPILKGFTAINAGSDFLITPEEYSEEILAPILQLLAEGHSLERYSDFLAADDQVVCDDSIDYSRKEAPKISDLSPVSIESVVVCVKISDIAKNIVYGKSDVISLSKQPTGDRIIELKVPDSTSLSLSYSPPNSLKSVGGFFNHVFFYLQAGSEADLSSYMESLGSIEAAEIDGEFSEGVFTVNSLPALVKVSADSLAADALNEFQFVSLALGQSVCVAAMAVNWFDGEPSRFLKSQTPAIQCAMTSLQAPIFSGVGSVSPLEDERGFSEVVVSWEAPAGDCSRIDISATTSPNSPNFATPVATTSCEDTSASIDGLTSFSQYYFQVQAVTAVGSGELVSGIGNEISVIISPPQPSGDQISTSSLTQLNKTPDQVSLTVTEANAGLFNKTYIWKSTGSNLAEAEAAAKAAAATKSDQSGPVSTPAVSLVSGTTSWIDGNVQLGISCYLSKSVYEDGFYYLASSNEQVACETSPYTSPSFSGVLSGKIIGVWNDDSAKIELTFAGIPTGSIEEYQVFYSQSDAPESFDTSAPPFEVVDYGDAEKDSNTNDSKILIGKGKEFTWGFFLVRQKFYGAPEADQDTNLAVSNYVAPYSLLARDISPGDVPQHGHENGNFGSSSDISADALTMVLGSPRDSSDDNWENEISNAGAVYVYNRLNTSSNWSFMQKLVPSFAERKQNAKFGASVAISGSSIVVGAANTGSGAAYVYTESGGIWHLEQKLVGQGINGQNDGDNFGVGVDIDGNVIVVGASEHAFDENGENFVYGGPGAAFIYRRSAGIWALEEKIVGEGLYGRNSNNYFGGSVAISGTTIAIGSYGYDYDEVDGDYQSGAGAVFVYKESGGDWSLEQKLVASGTNGRKSSDYLGYSVAIDGDSLIAGAYSQDYDEVGNSYESRAGAAYIFTRSGSTWSLQQKIVGQGPGGRSANDHFGLSVDLIGDRALVGAYKHDYDEAGNEYSSDAGAMYVFDRTGVTWSFSQKLVTNGSWRASDWFGRSVSLSTDAIVSGAPNHGANSDETHFTLSAGAGFAYDYSGGSFSLTSKVSAGNERNYPQLDENFGESLAVSDDGLKMIVCAKYHGYTQGGGFEDDTGAAYFFNRENTVSSWNFQQKITGEAGEDEFCTSVDMDGYTAIIGASDQDYDADGLNFLSSAGAAYIYRESGGSWALEQKLVGEGANGRMASDRFGDSVAVSGNSVVIGASGQDYDDLGGNVKSHPGAAYVYTRSGSNWSLQQKLVGQGLNGRMNNDSFGLDVDIDGDTILVGANNQAFDQAGANELNYAGAAFVFVRSGSSWSLQQKLVGLGINGRSEFSEFGASVSLSGNTAVIGAPYNSFDANGDNFIENTGAVFIFKRSGTTWSLEEKITGQGLNGRNENDEFGREVNVFGDFLIIGSHSQAYDFKGEQYAETAGAAFVFHRDAGTWSLVQKLTPENPDHRFEDARFGIAVSISGNVPIVGSTPVSPEGAKMSNVFTFQYLLPVPVEPPIF